MAGIPNFLPNPDLYPDPSGRAQEVCEFLSNLTLWEGALAGEKLYLHPFQEAMIRRIYGPCDEDGEMLVREANIWFPRGNAKTTLMSGVALAHFLGPRNEAGGQIICAAADRGNAGIAFNSALQMVKVDPELHGRIRPIESSKFMEHVKSSSILKAISTEAYSKHGMNASLFLADEIHAWPATEARKLWTVVTDSMVKRTHPLTIVISTAGEGIGSLSYEKWNYSMDVARGVIEDETFASIIFGADSSMEWDSEKTWYFANPALEAGFLNLRELTLKAKMARRFPGKIADFKRFHLNIWQEGSGEPWVDIDLYDEAEERASEEDLETQDCFMGLDLSSVEDLTAAVAVFPFGKGDNRSVDVLPMFFLPRDNLVAKGDKDQAEYAKWEREGWLIVTEGNRVDYEVVVKYIEEFSKRFKLKKVALDRWNSTFVSTRLMKLDIDVELYGQGMVSMSGPVKDIKRMILGREFRHGANPILRMCFLNIKATTDDAENEKFSKQKSNGRIDGAVAAAMGVGLILQEEVNETDETYHGIYSDEGKFTRAFGKKTKAQIAEEERKFRTDWDPKVINNIRHPDFQEHKERFMRARQREESRDGRIF